MVTANGMGKHLILHLEAPLLAFGAPVVDNLGVIQDFPSASALTGLIGNALGFNRWEGEKLQFLQDLLIYGTRIDRRPADRIIDFQTAKLAKDDKSWTTRGQPEGREGNSYTSPHLRYRHYDADAALCVALRLKSEAILTLDKIAEALAHPSRPLFLGRKACLPSQYLFGGFVEADEILQALRNAPLTDKSVTQDKFLAFWPPGEGETINSTLFTTTDRRNWISGVHAGSSTWLRGQIELDHLGSSQ